MFWKRKSKKQEGQEAPDSAAEPAATDEETEAAATAAEEPAAEGAGKEPAAAEESAPEEAGDAADEKPGTGEESAPDIFADEGEEPGVTGPDPEGITRVRTAGVFEFDDEKYEVVSNTWIVDADDEGVVVIDPGHDAEAVLEAVGERDIYLVACTNAYSPHIEAAVKVAEEAEAPVALHAREMRLWRRLHGAEYRPEVEVEGGGSMTVGDLQIDILALPGTSPGTVGYYISQLGVVFSGDTLRKGEPGMVGNTYIDYTTQLASIGESLLTLPPATRVLPDRGPATTSGTESKNFDEWV